MYFYTYIQTYIWFDKNKLTLKNKNIYIVTTHVQCTYICMKNIHMYEQVKFFTSLKTKIVKPTNKCKKVRIRIECVQTTIKFIQFIFLFFFNFFCHNNSNSSSNKNNNNIISQLLLWHHLKSLIYHGNYNKFV